MVSVRLVLYRTRIIVGTGHGLGTLMLLLFEQWQNYFNMTVYCTEDKAASTSLLR